MLRRGRGGPDPEQVRRLQRERLAVISALVDAQARSREVLDAVEAAGDDEEAARAVAALLGLQERHLAHAVLDLQVRRSTRRGRERLRQERDDLRAALGQHVQPGSDAAPGTAQGGTAGPSPYPHLTGRDDGVTLPP